MIKKWKAFNEAKTSDFFQLGTPARFTEPKYGGGTREVSGEVAMNGETYEKGRLSYEPNTIKGIYLYKDENYSGPSPRFVVPDDWSKVSDFYGELPEVNESHYDYDATAAPEGYSFASRKLTEKAKMKLKVYWNQRASYLDCQDDLDKDREEGRKVSYDWVNRYSNHMDMALSYLHDNKFIKKNK